ncbi:unnamed protein product [Cyprideis torosa]|uniref:Uncharacterized protein n=1 Tax=Cyprideis torosa TaxID=163714 RepID=A0A7R8ZT50_9CRUS|nr:unnamed protein product [Cyprideis torosa]CAG0907038.1 unnamed protein product [Cyprideis torosa]
MSTIVFAAHKDAKFAKENGTVLDPSIPPISLHWKLPRDMADPSLAFLSRARRRSSSGMAAATSSIKRKREEAGKALSTILKGRSSHREGEVSPLRSASDVPPGVGSSGGSAPRASSSVSQASAVSIQESVQDLMSIVRTPAFSAADKYRVLDARDKLLKRQRVREQDLSKAKAMLGVCPDMCPEKERYGRQEQRNLSLFEMSSNSSAYEVDHMRAVKAYARSSADQEEPLPFELRPGKVLRMTMDHLIMNVAGECNEANVSDWYLFMWDRTRSIRKDITQQQLSDLTAISLVEQCARFHIHCSAALCEEDVSVFDPKINDENLTKCLKTLEYMYDDLAKDSKGHAPHEAEFRAYDALLNLNTGDTLRKIQTFRPETFRPEVRSSAEIEFAVSIFLALNNRHYVKFFRLAASAPYLSSCLLLRYHTQARTTALEVISRSYAIGNKTSELPLSEIQSWLGFSSSEEARQFVRNFGLEATGDGRTVLIGRALFTAPEEKILERNSDFLVRRKLQGRSISECYSEFYC